LQIAKSLHDGNTDQAVDLLTKQAEDLKELIEKVEDEDVPEPPKDVKSDIPDEIPSDNEPEKKPVDKTVKLELTKTQVEWLEKFVEMYISA
jgi:gas vesicle protein